MYIYIYIHISLSLSLSLCLCISLCISLSIYIYIYISLSLYLALSPWLPPDLILCCTFWAPHSLALRHIFSLSICPSISLVLLLYLSILRYLQKGSHPYLSLYIYIYIYIHLSLSHYIYAGELAGCPPFRCFKASWLSTFFVQCLGLMYKKTIYHPWLAHFPSVSKHLCRPAGCPPPSQLVVHQNPSNLTKKCGQPAG